MMAEWAAFDSTTCSRLDNRRNVFLNAPILVLVISNPAGGSGKGELGMMREWLPILQTFKISWRIVLIAGRLGFSDDVIALLSYKEPIASLLYQHRLMGLAGVVAGLYAFLVVTHLICGFFFMIGLACVYGYEYWMRSRYTEVRSTGEWRQPRNWVVPVFATNLNVPGCSWR